MITNPKALLGRQRNGWTTALVPKEGSTVLEQAMAEYFDVPQRIDFATRDVSYEPSGSLDSVSEQAVA
jgi:hypothetical protein